MHCLSTPTPAARPRQTAGAVRGRCTGYWRWLLLGVWLGVWLPLQAVSAEPVQVQVLLSETGGAYSELLEALQQRLDTQAPGRIELRTRLVPEDAEARTALFALHPPLIITIGVRAAALALSEADELPVLSLLVPRDSYTALLQGASTESRGGERRSAIYLDQPLERQLDLLQLVLPKTRRLVALAGPHSQQRVVELEALCTQRGLQLATEQVAAAENPVPALMRLLDHDGVLLALPDPAIFNPNSLQAILLTTYRSGVPVLGFSQAYVRAGALAAVHSTATQIGTQAGEWIAGLALSGSWKLGAPRYPDYYSVTVNAQVAQTLGINVADEGALLERLHAREGPRPP